jgi:hypothetical protein
VVADDAQVMLAQAAVAVATMEVVEVVVTQAAALAAVDLATTVPHV